MIELHEIAIVKRATPEENPLGGSVIGTDLGKVIVLETPAEIIPMMRIPVILVEAES